MLQNHNIGNKAMLICNNKISHTYVTTIIKCLQIKLRLLVKQFSYYIKYYFNTY